MPSGSPNYYHWAADKPCTTNQVYGFLLKESMVKGNTDRQIGPFDYTRPFSNSGFFPQISTNQSTMTTSQAKPIRALRSANEAALPGNRNRSKSINRGYTAGYTPVMEKMKSSSLPSRYILNRSSSAPAKVHEHRKPKADDLYLWHTLAGNLVHVKNYHGEDGANMF